MSDSSNVITKEMVDQALLDGIHKAATEGNSKDAKELMAAYTMSERARLTAEKQADDYALRCTELEQTDEQTNVQREQTEAQREADIQKAVAQKTSAKITAACTLAGAFIGAVATIVTVIFTGRNQQRIEEQKVEYGLEFQKRHFDAQKEDDLVTRYNDESFRPR